MAESIPPGWTHNPSEWPRRLPVLALALAGCGIATYLALYQLGVLADVWEPFFGEGSRLILKESAVARRLPVPDALLGAFAYLLDAGADLLGGRGRWRTMPWAVLLLGVVSGLLGLTALVLVFCQAAVFHAYCTLCLASAGCSLLVAALVVDEVRAALGHLKREVAAGRTLWEALRGPGQET